MNIRLLLQLFHIFFVGSLFLYVGINKTNISEFLFNILLFLGIIIIFYHLYKVYYNINIGKSFWINIIHILVIGPLLFYIGYKGKNTERLYFELLLMLGFASIGYHLYYLVI